MLLPTSESVRELRFLYAIQSCSILDESIVIGTSRRAGFVRPLFLLGNSRHAIIQSFLIRVLSGNGRTEKR